MNTTALTAPPRPATVAVRAWRDVEPVTRYLPSMSLGTVEVAGPSGPAAQRLWDLGARRVEIPGTVDLTSPDTATTTDTATATATASATVHRLCLIRDLTARAVQVDWTLRLGPRAEAWEELGHLQPPTALLGPADPDAALRLWTDTHHVGKCLWRKGPGFVQIRDRRWGELRRFTVDEPDYQEVIERLVDGAPQADLPAHILADLRGEQLVGQVGELFWWLPYRVRRWAHAPIVL
ncbi:DUF5825 family protein [Kitasatospora sp. NBC_01250]|uniref:DUF5825 family protein n=1 Tax=Kitasatospora sp. NBC_01250 TaxID=2903571 RepID=UPI002E356DC0|nr:DUF5825 family protein [Kitasatospora sp. NBC_01250]